MVKILDGKKIQQKVIAELSTKIARIKGNKPTLVVIQVGTNAESSAYIERKKEMGKKIAANVIHIQLPEKITQKKLIEEIEAQNTNPNVHGILVQMPLPVHLDTHIILESINPHKDVDGLHSKSIHNWLTGNTNIKGFIPATARGVSELLSAYNISVLAKRVLVIGRSMLVGKPTAALLMSQGATVTIAHSHSKNLKELCAHADIIIVATGKAKLISSIHVKPWHIIVDVGINVVTSKNSLQKTKKLDEEIETKAIRTLVGDVDFDRVSPIVKAISPVPGGVGPMTIACLFENLLDAYNIQK